MEQGNNVSGTRAENLLELSQVSKSFGTQKVVSNVSIQLKRQDFVSIVGPSGCGKSTLLHLMAGLERPSHGEVRLAGQAFSTLTTAKIDALRLQNCAFVFQFFHLLPALTVLENVCLPALEKMPNLAPELKDRAMALLSRLGLADSHQKYPQELSGGMQSRTGFARAILMEPKILFADEPTGSLDSKSGELLLRELESYQEASSCALVLVTHDRNAAKRAKRSLAMRDGELVYAHEIERDG